MSESNKLMDLLAAPENLLTAWRTIRGNIPRYRRERSAGPDGISLTEFERDLPVQLNTLRHMLLKGRYQPQLPGLFMLQKRSGGTRQIALLNIVDRVAQRAAQQVIEPLYEPGFLPCSFGFRPGRSIQDAVYCARRLRTHGYSWVVDGDIAACFDSLDHRLLMHRIGKRIHDDRVLDLMQKWLSIGLLEHGVPADNPNWLEASREKIANSLRQGVEWVLNSFSKQDYYDQYSEARYEQPASPIDASPEPVRTKTENEEIDDVPHSHQHWYDYDTSHALQQRAIQQMAAGGLLLGTKWARHSLEKIGPSALAAMKTSTGRDVLRHGLLAGGGALGAVAGVAMTAYFLYRQVAPTGVGVLQGSPLSPLLANIYLHPFDRSVTQAGYRLVRFADDWVILCPNQSSAEAAYNASVVALGHIHLKVNLDKTHILSPADRLEWLGCVVG